MSTPQKSAINIAMGTMTFGEEGKDGARVHTVKDVEAILDVFQAHGHCKIDTARIYTGGNSEEFIGRIDWKGRGLEIDTKLFPILGSQKEGASKPSAPATITHSLEDIQKHLELSLKALSTNQVNIWYLHSPDRTTPYEVTLKAVNDIYKQGKFRYLGISNYMSWEVAEIVTICKANNYVLPSVYQGIYNAVHRNVEPELFPCLRKFGISFYEYNPLGGGFFTGRYRSLEDKVDPGSRFDPTKKQGQNYRNRYWNEPYFKALAQIEEVASRHNLTLPEVALRWVSHHSLLKREFGDAIIIGASSTKHVEQNLVDLEKGPLPEEVVKVLDKAWISVKPYATNYWH